MARRRPKSAEEEVRADFTSMLDVIFNVLAFFVVTFNPPKPEKNFDVTLPPPKKQEVEAQAPSESVEPELYEDVTIALRAGPGGTLQSINLEGSDLGGGQTGPPRLVNELRRRSAMLAFGDEGGLEAATIIADPTLKYEHLIAVVDACYQASIQKINFAEGGGSAE